MSKLLRNSILRVSLLPALGALGSFAVLLHPAGYTAFCGGLPPLVL